MATKEEVIDRIKAADLIRVQQSLEGALRDAIRVTTAPVGDVLELGVSRIGGTPDLPVGEKWPERNGKPLAFLAQFRMPDVAPFDIDRVLPGNGMMYFFYDAEEQPWGDAGDRGGWKVTHRESESPPVERKDPPESLSDAVRFPPRAVHLSTEATMPPYESELIQILELNDDEQEAYMELLGELGADESGRHRLLGHPDVIQNEMETQCEQGLRAPDYSVPEDARAARLAELTERAKRWRLLFQLDSDDDGGMMWGDVGRLYFWIPEDSLRARNFDDVWLVLQCY